MSGALLKLKTKSDSRHPLTLIHHVHVDGEDEGDDDDTYDEYDDDDDGCIVKGGEWKHSVPHRGPRLNGSLLQHQL